MRPRASGLLGFDDQHVMFYHADEAVKEFGARFVGVELAHVLEQVVIWPVRIAPTAPGRGLYKDSALLSLTIDPGVHGSPWSTRRSIGANCADCVRCNAWLTVATVYIGSEFARLW